LAEIKISYVSSGKMRKCPLCGPVGIDDGNLRWSFFQLVRF
jgi:hypothetical protein